MLVGREAERRAVSALLGGARVGSSGSLVLTGEPGIGKTTLLSDAETHSGEMRLLRARGIESERSVPFGGLLQLLRPILPLLERIPGPQADALASALLLDERRDPDPSRFAVGAATLSLLSRAAEERPIAALVDDAHDLDRPSAEALAFAARRFVSDAIALLVTTRAGEPGSRVWESLPTLVVTGLDLSSARELVAAESASAVREDQVQRLHRATGGNPLALLELGARLDRLDALPPDTPLQVSRELTASFLGQLDALGADARLALLVAAAAGTGAATVTRACWELGLTEAAVAEAQDSGLAALVGDEVRFRHPLVRSAVYGAADSGTRRRVHRALAVVLPPDEIDRFAWHLSESAVAPDETTAMTLDAAAGQASARGAFAIASTAHERAAQLSPTTAAAAGRLARAGRAAWRAGATERAVDLLDRALACQDDRRERALVQELRGTVQTRCGSLRSALRTLVDAGEDVRTVDPAAAVRLFSDAVHVCFYLGEPGTARRLAASVADLLAGGAEPRTEVVGTVAVGMAEILSGAGAAGAEHIRAALDTVARFEELEADELLLTLRVIGILWLREAGAHRSVVDEAVARLRRRVALGTLPYLLMHVARDDAAGDRWDDAEAGYLESIRLAEETGQWTDLAASQVGPGLALRPPGALRGLPRPGRAGHEAVRRASASPWGRCGSTSPGATPPAARTRSRRRSTTTSGWPGGWSRPGWRIPTSPPPPSSPSATCSSGASRTPTASPGSWPRWPRRRGSRGRRPGPSAHAPCAPPTTPASPTSERRSRCIDRPPTSSRPPAPSWPWVRGDGACGAGSTRGSRCGPRWRPSRRWAPRRGRTAPPGSCRQPARPRTAGGPASSSS